MARGAGRLRAAPMLAAGLWLAVAGLAAHAAARAPARLVVNVDLHQTARPISKYEYGMFIENLGQLVHVSLWSQLLDDRKFFNPILPKAAEPPRRAHSPFPGMQARRWHPVGPGQFVTMDTHAPFVGVHSPRVALSAVAPRGIEQSGLDVQRGKRYTGYLYLRATPGAKVRVTLRWGRGARARQTVTFPYVPAHFTRLPFHFTAGAGSQDARFEVTGTGAGTFTVGAASLMPADNIDGFRPGPIRLLRSEHFGFMRFPGGNFISDFNWYHAVGAPDSRPPFFDHAWDTVKSNDVGLDEFMTLCRLIDTRPYITVNAGFGGAHSAAREVEYMNGSVLTRYGAMRARDGHPAPYDVKIWNIGNEPYGKWELGHTSVKYYVLKNNEFARAMRRVDPSIMLLASGDMPDERINTDKHAAICSKGDFTCGFLKHSWGYFDGITQHWYASAVPGPHPAASPARAHPTLLQWVRVPSDVVHMKVEEWHAYQRLFPQMLRKKIFMSIDEYAYTGAPPDLKLSLAYAMMFNEMLRHTAALRMSAFTMGVSTLDFTRTRAILNTTGHLFRLYTRHMGPGLIPVKLTGNSPQPPPRHHVFGKFPHTNPGSPTYPLDMVAAVSPHRRYLSLAVVNATPARQRFVLNVAGGVLGARATLWRMTGPSLLAADTLGHSPQVVVKQYGLNHFGRRITVAPISIDIYHIPLVRRR
ncbi:MAG: alpha-N-arabinofuranosidase [Steroidobacteraceae bacterium]